MPRNSKHIVAGNATDAAPQTPDLQTTDLAVTTQAAAAVVEDLRGQAITLHQGELKQSLLLSQKLGTLNYARFIEDVSRISWLKTLWEIKTTKSYKGMSIVHSKTGEVVVTKTFEDFCDACGTSRGAVDEALGNLAFFGEQLIERQDQLGLSRRDLRMMKAAIAELSESEQQAVLSDISQMTDREEVLITLGELQVTTKKQAKVIKDRDADLRAKDELLSKKGKALQELELKLERLTAVSPDEADALQAEKDRHTRDAVTAVCNRLAGVASELANLAAAVLQDSPHLADWLEQTVSLACGTATDALFQAGLDVQLGQLGGIWAAGEADAQPAEPEADASPETVQQ